MLYPGSPDHPVQPAPQKAVPALLVVLLQWAVRPASLTEEPWVPMLPRAGCGLSRGDRENTEPTPQDSQGSVELEEAAEPPPSARVPTELGSPVKGPAGRVKAGTGQPGGVGSRERVQDVCVRGTDVVWVPVCVGCRVSFPAGHGRRGVVGGPAQRSRCHPSGRAAVHDGTELTLGTLAMVFACLFGDWVSLCSPGLP